MMINLGILTLCPDEPSPYFNELGRFSQEASVSLFLFSPLNILPGSDQVQGYRYLPDMNNWTKETFNIPQMLYDRCMYSEKKESKDAKAIVSWLKTRKDITFLGYGLPNKWSLYEKLTGDPEISPYLPHTKKVSSAQQIIEEAMKHKDIILKPVNGAHGFAVYLIEYFQNTLIIKTTKNGRLITRKLANPEESIPFFEKLLIKHIFIIQPRLQNVNGENQPFDLRVFLQKNEEGIWQERARGIRVGQANGILTNLSAGASIIPYSDWQSSQPGFNHPFLEREIDELLGKLPLLLEKNFFKLFELGIDLIIARNQSLWILDINSKPGRKLVAITNPESLPSLYKAPLSYCHFLAAGSIDERFEKTK